MNTFKRGEFVTGLAALSAGLLGGVAGAADPVATRRIDIHYHQFPVAYLAALRAHDQPPPKPTTMALAIEDMDRAGILTSMLSIPGSVWFGDATEARRVARQCNEETAAIVAAYPKRVGFFATLPLPDVEGSLREIEYSLDTLKADGVAMVASYGSKWLGDPAFTPVFAELNRRKALIYTHPAVPDCCGSTLPGVNPTMIELGTDTTRTMVSLLFNGVASRFGDMRIVFSHAGGTMTSLIDRFTYEARNPKVASNLPNGVLYELRRFFYDTAQAASVAPMTALTKIVPLSQIVFGSDFPFRDSLEQVNGLTQNGLFSQRDLQAIQFDNIVRLIPRLR